MSDDPIERRLDAIVSAYNASADAEERRRWTRDLNRRISEKSSNTYKPEFISDEEMLERCVYVEKRDEVVMLPPAWANCLGVPLMCVPPRHFQQMQKGNEVEHPTRVNRRGEHVMVPAADVWLAHPDRRCIKDAVFALGRQRFLTTPQGDSAVNLWTKTKRMKIENGDITLFLDHIAYLIPNEDDRARFLDWLAHCEQKPHELPHHGWLMFTEQFGIGRNWLASVLTRVWRGEVAPSLDLVALISGSFNSVIGCTRMAIIDEIHMGSNQSLFQMAARLRQMMTEETRVINPKYGKTTMEYNTTRWLVFSNHDDALPMPADDRRFEVVENPNEPRNPDYYIKLYKALDDPEFISGVAHYLANRDITGYNCGARPRMTEAKERVIEATTSQLERDAKEVLNHWKQEGILVFCASDFISAINASQSQIVGLHHIYKRLGVVPINRRQVAGKLERLLAVDKSAMDKLKTDGYSIEKAIERILLERRDGGLFGGHF